MRRYPLLFILLLSFIMPLQVAADILLSAPCPEEMTMVMDEADADEAMPCCPDADKTNRANPCKTSQFCNLCKTPAQVYLHAPALFVALSDSSANAKTSPLMVTTFNPASIWRPPNPA